MVLAWSLGVLAGPWPPCGPGTFQHQRLKIYESSNQHAMVDVLLLEGLCLWTVRNIAACKFPVAMVANPALKYMPLAVN